MDAAKGEYIAFIDADDYIPKDYFEILHSEMTDDVDMVRCEGNHYLPNGEQDTKWRYKSLERTMVLDSTAPENFSKYNHVNVWGVLYKRIIIGDLRFDTNYHAAEDTLFHYSALKKCRKIKHTVSTVYCYVLRPGSITNSLFGEKQFTGVYAWRDICKLYADKPEIEKIVVGIYVNVCHEKLNKVRYGYNGIDAMEKIKFCKHEIRRYLPYGLKRKDLSKIGIGKLRKAGFILDVFLPEKIYRFIMMSYYFVRNRKLYEQLKRKEQ